LYTHGAPQAVELQVPFNNHLLENTRRTYTEKHPLGRDKQQLSRLRADIGSSNGFGERVLEFTVSCDSPFFTVPSTVVQPRRAWPHHRAPAKHHPFSSKQQEQQQQTAERVLPTHSSWV
jgi:hypothetical protein